MSDHLIASWNALNGDKSRQENVPLATQVKPEDKNKTIFFSEKGVAIKGTDPVGYFLEHRFSIQNPVQFRDFGISQTADFRWLLMGKNSFWHY